MYISYDHYRIFYYAAKYGNITQAAEILRNSQPNLTRAIRTLEGELGCPLFFRNRHGVVLTPEGEKLYAHIRIAIEHIEAGEAELAASRDMRDGSVYIAASEVALHCALLPALAVYRERYPAIRLKVSNHSTPQAIDAIVNGIADMALVTTPTVESDVIQERTVSRFSEVAVCGERYADTLCGRRLSFSQLMDAPLISLGVQTKSFALYSAFFAAHGLLYRPETEAATADQILPLVRAGLGVGFVPRAFLTDRRGIHVIETEEPLPPREIRLVTRRGQPQSIAARALEDILLAGTAERRPSRTHTGGGL